MFIKTLSATAILAVLAVPAAAAHLSFAKVTFTPLNGSGVSGRAALAYDAIADTLNVRIRATGLEAGPHPAHIHGDLDPSFDAEVPPPAADTDGDGFIDLAEGVPFYGGILLTLDKPDGSFISVGSDGILDYKRTFTGIDESSGIFNFMLSSEDDPYADPLLDRTEIVLHGRTLAEGEGANPFDRNPFGEATGEGGYNIALPIAAGAVMATDGPAPIPLPAAGWALLAGLAGLGALRRRGS